MIIINTFLFVFRIHKNPVLSTKNIKSTKSLFFQKNNTIIKKQMWNISVRVRPFNMREIAVHEKQQTGNDFLKPIIKMKTTQIDYSNSNKDEEGNGKLVQCRNKPVVEVLEFTDEKGFHLPRGKVREAFMFDELFWSIPLSVAFNNDMEFADQAYIFKKIGIPAVDTLFSGKNVVVQAWGQTGSGKATTMICHTSLSAQRAFQDSIDETKEGRGLLPRVLDEIFHRIENKAENPKTSGVQYRVELRAMEIYNNEKIRDGLNFDSGRSEFKEVNEVTKREAQGPILLNDENEENEAPFLDRLLKKRTVLTSDHAKSVLHHFMKYRTYSDVRMGQFHSRSWGVFEIILTQIDGDRGIVNQSRMHLVDGAGTEKVRSGFYPGSAIGLQEAININRSFSNVRKCIDVMIDNNGFYQKEQKNPPKRRIPPVFDSVLTSVLKDMFLGRAQVYFVATISPHEINIEDTLGTLRMALRSNSMMVNEHPLCYVREISQKRERKQEAENNKDNGDAKTTEVITRSEVPMAKQWTMEEFFAVEKEIEDRKKRKVEEEKQKEKK